MTDAIGSEVLNTWDDFSQTRLRKREKELTIILSDVNHIPGRRNILPRHV